MSDELPTLPIPDRPLLRGEKVWLRPLEERDMPAYVAGVNDTEVGGIAGYKAPMSLHQAKGWLDFVNEKSKKGEGFFYAVCELGDNRFMGTTWLKEVDYWHGCAELAICMDRDHIGAGFGTDAQRVLLKFAFQRRRPQQSLADGVRLEPEGDPLVREARLLPRGPDAAIMARAERAGGFRADGDPARRVAASQSRRRLADACLAEQRRDLGRGVGNPNASILERGSL